MVGISTTMERQGWYETQLGLWVILEIILNFTEKK